MQFISLWHSDHSVNVDSHWLDTEAGDQNIGSCFFFFNIYIQGQGSSFLIGFTGYSSASDSVIELKNKVLK